MNTRTCHIPNCKLNANGVDGKCLYHSTDDLDHLTNDEDNDDMQNNLAEQEHQHNFIRPAQF